MKKTILIIAGVIVIVAASAAGSFFAGIAYQKSQAQATQQRFLGERGGTLPENGQFPGGQMPSAGQGMVFAGRGTSGEVTKINGDEITITTQQGEVTVIVSDDTQIQKTDLGSLEDIQVGDQLMVSGEKDEDDTVSASQVTILNGDFQMMPGMPPGEAAP